MHGRESRTALSAELDWTSHNFGELAIGVPEATYEDYNTLIAQHHENINAVQGRGTLASNLAQALTKNAWDAHAKQVNFKVGDQVLIHHVAPNKMLPHFKGPYTVESVSNDKNFITVKHYAGAEAAIGPYHISRMIKFDGSRTDAEDLIGYQLEPGSYMIDSVIEHRQLADKSYEFHHRWRGTPITSWRSGYDMRNMVQYCDARELDKSEVLAAPRDRGARSAEGGIPDATQRTSYPATKGRE
jgi:hypothetical protein